jgi:hypothetical protein
MSRTVNVDQLRLVTSAIPSQSILLHEISGKLYANNKLVGGVTEELFSATTGEINNSITGLQNDLSILVGDAPEHLDTIFELADFASGIDSTVSGLVTKEVFSAATGDIDQSMSGLQSQLTLLVGDAPEHLDTIFELADFGSGLDVRISALESSPSISPNAPTLPTSLGSAGDIAYDSDYMYICVNDNSWKRTALASWA